MTTEQAQLSRLFDQLIQSPKVKFPREGESLLNAPTVTWCLRYI